MLLIRLIANPDRIWQLYMQPTNVEKEMHWQRAPQAQTYLYAYAAQNDYHASLQVHFDFDIASFWLDSNLLLITIYRYHWTRFLSFHDFWNIFHFFFGCHQISNIIISKSHQSKGNEWTSVLKWNSPKSLAFVFALVSNKSAIISSEHFQLGREHKQYGSNMLKICFHSFHKANAILSLLFKGITVIDILDKLKRQRFHYIVYLIFLCLVYCWSSGGGGALCYWN